MAVRQDTGHTSGSRPNNMAPTAKHDGTFNGPQWTPWT